MFSPFIIWARGAGPNLFKESLPAAMAMTPPGIWSTALVEISINGAGCSQAAFGRRPESATHLLYFLFRQVTSAPAGQYSVLIIHGVSPFTLGPSSGPSSLKEVFTADGY
jgi:hypothetical protein